MSFTLRRSSNMPCKSESRERYSFSYSSFEVGLFPVLSLSFEESTFSVTFPLIFVAILIGAMCVTIEYLLSNLGKGLLPFIDLLLFFMLTCNMDWWTILRIGNNAQLYVMGTGSQLIEDVWMNSL